MTATALTTALIAVLTISPATAAEPDFSGTWVLDSSRSEGLWEDMEQTMTVRQSGDRIEVETHTRTPSGDRGARDLFVLDGSETDFQPVLNVQAEATGTRTSRWLEGRAAFEATERMTVEAPTGEEITLTSERKWELSPDGDTLVIEVTTSTPQGEATVRRVFTRQGGAS